jgi:acyl dehydratase
VRYWEDIKEGEVVELGSHTMDKERMIAFAREFDPQPFHTDDNAAAASIYGGLIASGWLTGSTLMRLFYDGFLKDTASMGSPGIDELRWLKPVRPGDTLSARLTVTETTPSRSKPDRGLIRSLMEVLNQHGEVVMTTTGVNFFRRRPAVSAD